MIPLALTQSDQLMEPALKKGLFSIDMDNNQLLSFEFQDQCNEERDSPELRILTGMHADNDTRDYSLSYPGATEYLESSVYDYDLLVSLETDKFRNLANCH